MKREHIFTCGKTCTVVTSALTAFVSQIAVTSCSKSLLSDSQPYSEVPGFHPGIPTLGKPYDSVSRTLLSQPCVQGETEKVGNTVGEVKYSRNMSYEEILAQFSTGVDVALPEWAGLKAGVSYATENKSTSLSDTHSIFLSATPKSIVYLPDSLKPSQEALNILNSSRSNELHSFCGDEFVNRLDLGASMIATLKVEFASEADKREFNANADIRIGLGNANADLSGNVKKLSESVRTNTKIRIRAMQFGGQPAELFSILPDESVVCTLTDLSPCLGIFSNVIKYAQSGFKNQLETSENFNIIKAVTLSYQSGPSGVWPLKIDGLNPQNELQYAKVMESLRQAFKYQTEKRAQALEIVQVLKDELSDLEAKKLQSIIAVTTENTLRLKSELEACRLLADFNCKDPSSIVQTFDESPLVSKYVRTLAAADFVDYQQDWNFESNYYKAEAPHPTSYTKVGSTPLGKEHLAFGVTGDGFFCLNNPVKLKLSKQFSLEKNSRVKLKLEGFREACRACEGEAYVEVNGQRMAELPLRAGGTSEIEWDAEAGEIKLEVVSSTRKLCQDSQAVYLNSFELERILRQ